MTDRPAPWKGVFNYLADLAEAKPNAADYAMKVREVYDVLAEDGEDGATAREFLLFQVSRHHHRGVISKQHCQLVDELLPKPPARGRGRPKSALGKSASDRKHKLYLDWIYESAVDPSLTKERFAKNCLGVTDDQYKNDDLAHTRVKTFLQALKPARMKYIDEDQRRVFEIIYRLSATYPQSLARQWREAKQNRPALTKKDFLRSFFGWERESEKLHPVEADMIREFLKKLNQGEKLLGSTERG